MYWKKILLLCLVVLSCTASSARAPFNEEKDEKMRAISSKLAAMKAKLKNLPDSVVTFYITTEVGDTIDRTTTTYKAKGSVVTCNVVTAAGDTLSRSVTTHSVDGEQVDVECFVNEEILESGLESVGKLFDLFGSTMSLGIGLFIFVALMLFLLFVALPVGLLLFIIHQVCKTKRAKYQYPPTNGPSNGQN